MKLHRRHTEFAYLCVFVLDAQGPGPGALNRIHDGLDHFRGGALASQVSSVQLENKGGDAWRGKHNVSRIFSILYVTQSSLGGKQTPEIHLYFFFCSQSGLKETQSRSL